MSLAGSEFDVPASDQFPPSVPPSTWQKDDVVEGLYEVRDVITSGGMGDVHRVWHREWDVELASAGDR
jgi:hypothetical protein